ncbi:MAG TPA: DUF6298 domain-containing protein, partial [Anaerolineales bacterium]|nr:DUF6298 domain-containing protein [Anaerolineales bacterium]
RPISAFSMTEPPAMNPSRLVPHTNGPLQVSDQNSRYFMDASGNIVYITGSHTWAVLQDNGGSFPPPVFDYTAWLDFLQANGHNFFRLWAWEQARWTLETTDENYWFYPMPYLRTGPGNALDGQPKFDLTQFNQAYFDRMRARVIEARDRGIYVSVMLFDGWSNVSEKGGYQDNNPWLGHPFNASNNINGIDGDTNNDNSGEEIHELGIPAVTALQQAYIQKVIDTVNDLDNVLYEIANESHSNSVDWQYHWIDYIHTYEAGKPYQHPVGMTSPYPGGWNPDLFDSNAEWISINNGADEYFNPSPADGSKVLLTDTDHLCGICGDEEWVWRTFTRGHNPIFMDGYDGEAYGVGAADFNPTDPWWPILRANLGYTRSYANRMNMAAIIPHGELSSTGYALANPVASGAEYLVYSPSSGSFTVNLSNTPGQLNVEWLNPEDGSVYNGGVINGGGNHNFTPPFSGSDSVLYLYDSALPTHTPSPTSFPTTPNPSPTPTNGTPTPSKTPTPTSTATEPGPTPTPTLTPTPDNTPPILSNIAASPLDISALITWNSDEPATSLVNYGISPTLTDSTDENLVLTTNHSVILTGLTPGTTYVFRVVSFDAARNRSNSEIFTFTTLESGAVYTVYLPLVLKPTTTQAKTTTRTDHSFQNR